MIGCVFSRWACFSLRRDLFFHFHWHTNVNTKQIHFLNHFSRLHQGVPLWRAQHFHMTSTAEYRQILKFHKIFYIFKNTQHFISTMIMRKDDICMAGPKYTLCLPHPFPISPLQKGASCQWRKKRLQQQINKVREFFNKIIHSCLMDRIKTEIHTGGREHKSLRGKRKYGLKINN